MCLLTLHVDQVKLCHPNISIHAEKLIEFSHLEEEDNIIVLRFQRPPLLQSWGLFVEEVLGHIQSPGVILWMVFFPTLLVFDVLRPQPIKLLVSVHYADAILFW